MIDPKLVKMLSILLISGSVGSLIALLPLLFRRDEAKPAYGTTAGIGFLIGASIGGLFGIFAVLLDQI